MSTGSPFNPAAFSTTVVAPETISGFRTIPYISPSEYRFAPTAVGTKNLVAGSTSQQADSLASLAQEISRASSWADLHCFHKGNGSFQANVTVESDWVKVKQDGSLALICNQKPVREVVGVGLGPDPSQIANISSSVASSIWISGEKVIYLPSSTSNTIPTFTFPRPTDVWGKVYAVWSYISGWPHTYLSAAATAGTNTITVAATNGSLVAGVYAGTQLTIRDGANTEVVTVSATPTSNVLTLSANLQYSHTPPLQPDFIRVTALPQAIEKAVIHLTSCSIKLRGARAQVMPTMPGGVPGKQAFAEAGALEDFEIAAELLEPFTTVYVH